MGRFQEFLWQHGGSVYIDLDAIEAVQPSITDNTNTIIYTRQGAIFEVLMPAAHVMALIRGEQGWLRG